MSSAVPPASTAPTQASSLSTMLQTVETGVEVLQKIMPEVAAVGGFVPGATPIIQIIGLALGPVQNALKFIMEQTGKSPMQAFEEFLLHIGPGQQNSPSLSSTPVTKATP